MPPERDEEELLDDETLRQLERLSLPLLRALTPGLAGERQGPATGPRADFADYRRYVPGDDLRRVDWNVYARLRQLAVKVGAEEGRLALVVLLDTSRSMLLGTPEKLLHARPRAWREPIQASGHAQARHPRRRLTRTRDRR